MRVLVCDDEQLGRERITRIVMSMEECEVVGEAINGVDAIEKVQSSQPDLVLLDIQMPLMTGLEAAAHIAKMDDPPAVIFCTAYDEYALEAFKVSAIDYLLKPVRESDLVSALKKLRRINKAQMEKLSGQLVEEEALQGRSHISAKTRRGIELVPVDDIRYFKADQKYVVIRHSKGEILVDETLKELESEFGGRVLRAHRNALVCLKYIDGLDAISVGHYELRFKGIEDKVQVSRRHVAAIRKAIKQL